MDADAAMLSCSALVAGNAVKAGVRFLSYDAIKLAVADKEVSRRSSYPLFHLPLTPSPHTDGQANTTAVHLCWLLGGLVRGCTGCYALRGHQDETD